MMEPVRRLVPFLLVGALTLCACSGGASNGPSASGPGPMVHPSPSSQPQALAWAVVARHRLLKMWEKPTDPHPSFALDTFVAGQGPGQMLVAGERTIGSARWLRVLLPIRPNGSAAWVSPDDVRMVPLNQEIVVDLSGRTLSRYRGGNLIERFRVGVGKPQYPTAIGTFYVWQKVAFHDWYGPYGVYALGLSGFSPVLSDWPGGGRMAIHGTWDASDRGKQVSHGCLRVYNRQMEALRNVPLGTPVVIHR
jgi:hypothetical protein